MAPDTIWLQNYTYVDPVLDPLVLFLLVIVTVLVVAGLTVAWSMHGASTAERSPVDEVDLGVEEPFVRPGTRASASSVGPAEAASETEEGDTGGPAPDTLIWSQDGVSKEQLAR
jgi:hypothetical protein